MFDKKDVLLVVACKEESNGLLEKLGIDIVYTGVGKINATYNLTKKIYTRKFENNLPKVVINVGSCGSKKFKKGTIVSCNKFIQKDMDCRAFGYKIGETPSDIFGQFIENKQLLSDLPSAICASGDKFETEECNINGVDVVEMEAYALARVCKIENIDFISIKYITDGLDEYGEKDWDNNVLNSAESFYNYLSKLVR